MPARAARLREAGDVAYAAHLAARTGSTARVLIEKPGIGRTEDFTLASAEGVPGDIVSVAIAGHDGEKLLTRPALAGAA